MLIGGRRRPIVGVVTMDQLMVDCGDDAGRRRATRPCCIGAQGSERITADDWAARLGTIAYEVVCGSAPASPGLYQGEEPPSRLDGHRRVRSGRGVPRTVTSIGRRAHAAGAGRRGGVDVHQCRLAEGRTQVVFGMGDPVAA